MKINDRSAEALREMGQMSHEQLRGFSEEMTEHAKEQPAAGGAPVDTGNLRDSLDFEEMRFLGFRVFTETGYGGYVELGTSRREANPFLARAFAKARSTFKGK